MAETPASMFVTDTHSLIWYFYDAPRLSHAAQRAFDRVDVGQATLIIPIIVLAELVFLAEKGRLDIDVEATLQRIVAADNYIISPFDLEAISCLENTTAIPEMHDRMIVLRPWPMVRS